MGNRANIQVSTQYGQVNLYTHFDGDEILSVLRAALVRDRERWDDAPYLARIIFSEMIQDSIMELIGFGIWDTVMDGKFISVNVETQIITAGSARWTFKEFVNKQEK